MATQKGFIKDWAGRNILPITRGELVLDKDGNIALNSKYFLAGENGSQYGLITAAEREMLSGGGSGSGSSGITDLYNRLDYINSGLQFNGQTLNFYDINSNATPIQIGSTGDGKLIIGVSNNVINFTLEALTNNDTTASNIVKGLQVDKFGRVISVTSDILNNSDIPSELTGKTLTNAVLKSATTADKEIGTDEKAIVNKAYVDAKVQEVTGVATGALKFGGGINSANEAETALTSALHHNSYFKVTTEFEINTSDLKDSAGISGSTLKVKVGDTLIVVPTNGTRSQFVYVPSGDDVTTITVRGEDEAANALTTEIGNVTLKFGPLFNVKNNPSGSRTAYITFPQASQSTGGYLSKEDYAAFKNYANSLSVDYVGEFSSGAGVYTIGTLTLGSGEKIIYGKNNITTLTLNNGSGTNPEYNPILKFTETGATDVSIAIKGLNGILTKKNGNNIEIGAANEIIEQTVPGTSTQTQYLIIDDGYKFGVQIGEVDADGNITQHGLTDFSQFINLVSKVSQTTRFEVFEYSLKGSASTTEYRYGNQLLKDAIALATI